MLHRELAGTTQFDVALPSSVVRGNDEFAARCKNHLATVRQDDGSLKKVLTGTSYKRWYVQATEYIFRVYGTRESGWQYRDVVGRVVGVERSNSPWIGWGGLKWCDEDIFQQELNREGCQQGEPRHG